VAQYVRRYEQLGDASMPVALAYLRTLAKALHETPAPIDVKEKPPAHPRARQRAQTIGTVAPGTTK
jgi:hypothetical protein